MKRLLAVFTILSLVCCSFNKEDEQMIENTMEDFYKYLNNKKYKDLSEVLSPNMKKELPFLKSLSNENVRYTSIKVENIDIIGEKATVVVSTIDEFNNKANFTWNMIKIKNLWKVDNYNYINHNNSYNTDANKEPQKKTITDTLQKAQTLSLSTNIQEQEL